MANEYPRLSLQAFDVVAGLRNASQISDVGEIAFPIFSRLGFSYCALVRFFRADASAETSVFHSMPQPPWAQQYYSNGHARDSLIPRHMLVTNAPYSWSDVTRLGKVDLTTKKILNDAHEFGYDDGMYCPSRSPDGSYDAVVLCGSRVDLLDPYVRTAADILSTYYAMEVRRFLRNKDAHRPLLSARQRECLAWVRLGKSSSDISDILGISAYCVNEYIAAACRKLNVRTRVQAVVEALNQGMID